MKVKLILVAFCIITNISTAQTKHNGREYVDLGLLSGTLWATCNIGATSPEQYGHYYAWGETTTKSEYNLRTYKDTEHRLGKYRTKDNKILLDTNDDAAHVIWGGKWRMPTKTEMEELVNACSWIWTTISGTNGYHVTGPNGNYIFLPAAGFISHDFPWCGIDGFDGGFQFVNENISYWTSSSENLSPWHLEKYYYSESIIVTTSIPCNGFPIRPVCGKNTISNNKKKQTLTK